jgi:hypothetical protein
MKRTLALALLVLISNSFLAATQKKDASAKDAACGPAEQKHKVIKQKQRLTPAAPAGKALVYFYWRGSAIRSWSGVQTKLARDGRFVAVLSKNTYAVIEVDPGPLKLCSSGMYRATSANSLLSLTFEEGKTYYLEGKPGGDLFGTIKPALVQVSNEDGAKAVAKSQYVTFEVKK